MHSGSPAVAPAARRIDFLGGPLDPVTMTEAVAAVERMIETRTPGQHGCLNAAKLVRLQQDDELRAALWSCDLVTADGQAVVWAARLLGTPVPERVAGIDLMERLLDLAVERGFRVYLLGARQNVLERAEAVIRGRHPGIVIAGSHHGYFRPEDEHDLVTRVAETRPDLLFIALDTPKKELFLARHRDRLAVPAAMGVGGTFDVLAGVRRRAPQWAQRAGLEWLFRLAQEPRRLAKRYVVGNARFIALVLGALARRERGLSARSRPDPAAAHQPTVLFVGPAPTARGGVAAVIAGLASEPADGFRIDVLPTFTGGGPLRKLASFALAIPRAARRIPSRDVALVHIHVSAWWSFRRKLLFYGLARLCHKPVVWHIHCSRFPAYLREARPLERRIVAAALRGGHSVICVSGFVGEQITDELGLPVKVLQHPVPRLELGEPQGEVVVALGELTAAKGTFVLLRAFARVVERIPTARLVVAGLGDLADATALARELGIEDAVEFPGWVTGAQKSQLLERAALVAHPSFAEALPMAVLEALAAGRPVVASRVGGIPEVVEHGTNGLLVEPGDVDELAAALTRLLTDHPLRARMAAAASETAQAFEPGAVLGQLAELYERAWARIPARA